MVSALDDRLLSEDVRVALDHLVDHDLDRAFEPRPALLLAQPTEERELEQEIAELFGEAAPVAPIDRVGDLVRFLEQVGADLVEALLAIPGTTARSPQAGDQRVERVEVVGFPFAH